MKPDIAVYAMHKPESNVKIFKELSKNLPDGRFLFFLEKILLWLEAL